MEIIFKGTPEAVLAEISQLAATTSDFGTFGTTPVPELKTVDKPKAKAKAKPKKAEPEAEEVEANEPPEAKPEEPKSTRRKRGTTAETSEGESEADAPSRRRRRGTPDEGESTISDADLSLAASNAAQAVGPEGVTKILDQFGVGEVSKLEGDQRREFIDQTKEAASNAK